MAPTHRYVSQRWRDVAVKNGKEARNRPGSTVQTGAPETPPPLGLTGAHRLGECSPAVGWVA